MKKTQYFFDKENTVAFCYGLATMFFLVLGWSLMSPFWETVQTEKTLKEYLEIAETHDKGGAEIAAALAKYMPAQPLCEDVRVPVWIEKECEITECDCSVDFNEGFLEGHNKGVSEGWSSSETITEPKENPKEKIFKARNRRESKRNLPAQ